MLVDASVPHARMLHIPVFSGELLAWGIVHSPRLLVAALVDPIALALALELLLVLQVLLLKGSKVCNLTSRSSADPIEVGPALHIFECIGGG